MNRFERKREFAELEEENFGSSPSSLYRNIIRQEGLLIGFVLWLVIILPFSLVQRVLPYPGMLVNLLITAGFTGLAGLLSQHLGGWLMKLLTSGNPARAFGFKMQVVRSAVLTAIYIFYLFFTSATSGLSNLAGELDGFLQPIENLYLFLPSFAFMSIMDILTMGIFVSRSMELRSDSAK